MDTNKSENLGPLLNTREAANYLGCSTALLEKLRWKGSGPVFIKVGKSVRYRKSAIDIWLRSRERTATNQHNGLDKVFSLSIDDFLQINNICMSVRTYNCLRTKNVGTIGELVQTTASGLLCVRNFGRKSYNETKHILAKVGLSLGMRKDEIKDYHQKTEQTF